MSAIPPLAPNKCQPKQAKQPKNPPKRKEWKEREWIKTTSNDWCVPVRFQKDIQLDQGIFKVRGKGIKGWSMVLHGPALLNGCHSFRVKFLELPKFARVGFGTNSCDVNLGEDEKSWGFDSYSEFFPRTSNVSPGEYCFKFSTGDEIECSIDLDNLLISYAINGASLGICSSIETNQIQRGVYAAVSCRAGTIFNATKVIRSNPISRPLSQLRCQCRELPTVKYMIKYALLGVETAERYLRKQRIPFKCIDPVDVADLCGIIFNCSKTEMQDYYEGMPRFLSTEIALKIMEPRQRIAALGMWYRNICSSRTDCPHHQTMLEILKQEPILGQRPYTVLVTPDPNSDVILTEMFLRSLFSHAKGCVVIENEGEGLGYGFVHFDDLQHAENADEHPPRGLNVRFNSVCDRGTKLNISAIKLEEDGSSPLREQIELPKGIRPVFLRNILERFGPIGEFNFRGKSALVSYIYKESADAVVEHLNKKPITIITQGNYIYSVERQVRVGRENKFNARKCKFGQDCQDFKCRFIHPRSRVLCPNGSNCKELDCKNVHPLGRPKPCTINCWNVECDRLHPRGWNPCVDGSECRDSACECSHPPSRVTSNRTPEGREQYRQAGGLPILKSREEFIERLRRERILIVIAETGSGKTTQLPQYAADHLVPPGMKVVCTQPRQMAAMTIAKRVAEEYDDADCGINVGYKVGGRASPRADIVPILFETDSMLIQESQRDPDLSKISVLIIDEAHERSLNTDIVLGISKMVMERRRDFYVVVASATIDERKFLDYFGVRSGPLKVPGRTFPVTHVERPLDVGLQDAKYNTSLVSEILRAVNNYPGHVLVFLPGQNEIEKAIKAFFNQAPPGFVALPLYGSLPPEEQQKIMQFPVDDSKGRLVTFCTNIAETSLTIPGVRIVIDSGYAREARFDQKQGMTILELVKIARSNADQRKGRAGRTSSGVNIRLYPDSDLVRPSIEPEILRSSLDLVVLQLKRLNLDPLIFPFIDRPDPQVIQNSLKLLTSLECLDANGTVTPLGRLYSELPFDPRMSSFVVQSHIKYRLLDEAAAIASICSAPGSIFFMGGGKEKKMQTRQLIASQAAEYNSDLLYQLDTFKCWLISGLEDCKCIRRTKNPKGCRICRVKYSNESNLNNKVMELANETYINVSKLIKSYCEKNRIQIRNDNTCGRDEALGRMLALAFGMDKLAELLVPALPNGGARVMGKKANISSQSYLLQKIPKNPSELLIYLEATSMNDNLYLSNVHPVDKSWVKSTISLQGALRTILEMENVGGIFKKKVFESLRDNNLMEWVVINYDPLTAVLKVYGPPQDIRLPRVINSAIETAKHAAYGYEKEFFFGSGKGVAIVSSGPRITRIETEYRANRLIVRGLPLKNASEFNNWKKGKKLDCLLRWSEYWPKKGDLDSRAIMVFAKQEDASKWKEKLKISDQDVGAEVSMKLNETDKWFCTVKFQILKEHNVTDESSVKKLFGNEGCQVKMQSNYKVTIKYVPDHMKTSIEHSTPKPEKCIPKGNGYILFYKDNVTTRMALERFNSFAVPCNCGTGRIPCKNCNGSGKITCRNCRGRGGFPSLPGLACRVPSLVPGSACEVCSDSLRVDDRICGGLGYSACKHCSGTRVTKLNAELDNDKMFFEVTFQSAIIAQRAAESFKGSQGLAYCEVKYPHLFPKLNKMADEAARRNGVEVKTFSVNKKTSTQTFLFTSNKGPKYCGMAASLLSASTKPIVIKISNAQQELLYKELRTTGKLKSWCDEQKVRLEVDGDLLLRFYGPQDVLGDIMRRINEYSEDFENRYQFRALNSESFQLFKQGKAGREALDRLSKKWEDTVSIELCSKKEITGIQLCQSPNDEEDDSSGDDDTVDDLVNCRQELEEMLEDFGIVEEGNTPCVGGCSSNGTISLNICGHWYCQSCLNDATRLAIQSRNNEVKCKKCSTSISSVDLVKSEEYENLCKVLVIKHLKETNHPLALCCTRNCEGFLTRKPGLQKCFDCEKYVCVTCGISDDQLHDSVDCREYQRRKSGQSGMDNFLKILEDKCKEWVQSHIDISLRLKRFDMNPGLSRQCQSWKKFRRGLQLLGKDQLDFNRDTIFSWHGTPDDNGLASICENGWDVTRRKGQAYGRGEYFGITAQASQGYSKSNDRMIVALLLKGAHLSSHNNFCHVVDNPMDNNTLFCLPVGVVSYNNSDSPPCFLTPQANSNSTSTVQAAGYSPPFHWHWQMDAHEAHRRGKQDTWEPYRSDVSCRIERNYEIYARQNGPPIYRDIPPIIKYNNDLPEFYEFNFRTMEQTNLATGYKRKLNRKQCDFGGNKQWYYSTDQIQWIRIEDADLPKMNQAYSAYISGGPSEVKIAFTGAADIYLVDFKEGHQTNLNSGRIRYIKSNK